MNRFLQLALILITMLMTNMCFAVHVTTLYQAEIPIATQSDDVRIRMLPQALEQVLIKVTGNNTILNNNNVKAHLQDANTLMQEFSYVPSNNAANPYLLTVQFDSDGINKLLRDVAVPIWGANRPLIVAWVDYEAKDRTEIIDNASPSDIRNDLRQSAIQRGLPIIFPMMDMTDLNLVSANDIVLTLTPKLQNASKRYNSDAILILRVMQKPTGYQAQGKLVLDKDEWNLNFTGKTVPDVFNSVTDYVMTMLAGRYATIVTNAVQSTLALKITGINQQSDFAQMVHYLQHLLPVSSVQVTQVTGSDVFLNINLHSVNGAFAQTISVGKKLIPVAAESNDKLLVYQWNH